MSGNRSRTQMLSEIPQSVSLRHLTAQINAQGTLRARGSGQLLSKGQTSGDLGWIGFSMPVLEFLGRIREVASNHDRCNWVDCATAWAEDIRVKSVAPVKGPSAPSLLGW